MFEWRTLAREEFLSNWYQEFYTPLTYGGFQGEVQKWMHNSIEQGYSRQVHFETTLELGANNGEHLPFVRHGFDRYILSDIRVPNSSLLENTKVQGVEAQQIDATKINMESSSVDRILHMCLLHHIPDAESALIEIRRVLRPGGTADLFVSGDPGLAFSLARQLGPLRQMRKIGLGDVKQLVDARDHIGHVRGLSVLIRHIFARDLLSQKSFPFGLLGWQGVLWRTFRIQKAVNVTSTI